MRPVYVGSVKELISQKSCNLSQFEQCRNADRLDIHVIWFPLHVQLHLHSVILLSFDLDKTCSTYASEI